MQCNAIQYIDRTRQDKIRYLSDWMNSVLSASGFVSSYRKIVCLFSTGTPSFSKAN